MTRDSLYQRLVPIFGALDEAESAALMADLLADVFAEARDHEIHKKLDRLILLTEKVLQQERLMATAAQLKNVADTLQTNLTALQTRLTAAIAAAQAADVDDTVVSELQAVADGMAQTLPTVAPAVTSGDHTNIPAPIAAPQP